MLSLKNEDELHSYRKIEEARDTQRDSTRLMGSFLEMKEEQSRYGYATSTEIKLDVDIYSGRDRDDRGRSL